jgi:hypothetical protein
MKNNKHQHLLYRTPLSCATVGRCQTNKALIRLGELLRVLRPTVKFARDTDQFTVRELFKQMNLAFTDPQKEAKAVFKINKIKQGS